MEYFPHLRCSLTSPLVEQGNNGVPQVVQLLDDYDLLREDFDSILDVTAWPGSKDPMSQVETKVNRLIIIIILNVYYSANCMC